MADSYVQLNTDGSGKKIDTRTEGSNSEHRQVMVIGDPATNANVAPVDVVNGLSVTLTTAIPTGANTIGALSANQSVNVAQINGVTTTMGNGASGTGVQRVTIANDSTGVIALSPSTTAGWSVYVNNALSNTVVAVKASAGTLAGWHIFNPNAVAVYIQIWNLGTGSVTVGTTANTMSLGIPAGTAANVEFTAGIPFGTAISIAATTTVANSTAPTTAIPVNVIYK